MVQLVPFLLLVAYAAGLELHATRARVPRARVRASRVCCVSDKSEAARSTTAAAAASLLVGLGLAMNVANSCFGILDQTADELADLLGVDDVPPALVQGVLAVRPLC